MSRTIPRAYVTAAWSKNRVDAENQARKYCSELVKAGYLPLCPVLAFSGIIADDDPDGEKKRREMSEDLLKESGIYPQKYRDFPAHHSPRRQRIEMYHYHFHL